MDEDEEKECKSGDAELIRISWSRADGDEANEVDKEAPVEEVILKLSAVGVGHVEGSMEM